MRLHELSPVPGSTKEAKRKGRGHGSGNGKTAGRGHKGQNARSGGGVRPGFEGGQMPLYRRLPKRGFVNIFAKKYTEVKVSALNVFEDGAEVTAEALKNAGVIKKINDGITVLGNGEITKKLTVKAAKFTQSAKEKIEAAKAKFNPTEAEKNPNMKFADNALAKLLDEDVDFKKLFAKKFIAAISFSGFPKCSLPLRLSLLLWKQREFNKASVLTRIFKNFHIKD